MYYCFDCTNNLLAEVPLVEFDVNTRILKCSNCKKLRPCIIDIKNEAMGKLNFDACDRFFKSAMQEMLDRWDEPDFQEEKEIFIKNFFLKKVEICDGRYLLR